MMTKRRLSKRLFIRADQPLIDQLKEAAARDVRPLSSFVRKTLIEAVAASKARRTVEAA